MKIGTYSLQKIAVLLYTFYIFFYDLIEHLEGRKVALGILILSLILCLGSILFSKDRFIGGKTLLRNMIPWMLFMFIFVVPRNQMLLQGNYWLTIKWIVAMLFSFLIASRPGKYNAVLIIMMILGFVHVTATWILYLTPSLYKGMYGLWGAWPIGTAQGTMGYKAGLTNHYSRNAIMIVTTTLLSAACLFSFESIKKGGPKKWMRITILMIAAGALILTAKRAGLLFGSIAIIAGYYVATPSKRTGRLFHTICLIAVALIAIEVMSSIIPALSIALDRFALIGEDSSSTNRMLMWKLAVDLFLKYPLFGIGWGGYRYYYFSEYSHNTGGAYDYLDAHNVYLQMLAETGIIGTALFMVCMISTLIITVRLINRKRELDKKEYTAVLYSFIYQVFIIFYCLTGNCIYDITFMHYALAIAFSFGTYNRLRNKEAEQ